MSARSDTPADQPATADAAEPGGADMPAGYRAAPDDTEKNQNIAEATDLIDALWEIATKYDVPVTNNEPRWQNGAYLREIGDFIGDIRDAITKHTNATNA